LTLAECLEDKRRPFGHELVLACVLLGESPWEDGKDEEEDESESEDDD
jgi:hypothetical protein